MSSQPRVTVFIPVHNREHYIRCAIESILAQDLTDFELLIVDDGSTDHTVDVIASYPDPRIRLVENGRNLGIPASRNRGLELARGEFIALLDSDDYAYPLRLSRQVRFLERHPHIAQVGSWCSLMDSEGALLKRIRRQPTRPHDVDVHLLFHCALINRTIMARTALLRQFGYDETFPRCQDYELHARLTEQHPVANLPQILVCGREHEGRVTRSTRDIGRHRKLAIQRRLLHQLGIRFDDSDLERHYGLTQKPAPDRLPALENLAWAERWLHLILEANRRSHRYDTAALQRATALIWASTCWFDRAVLGRKWPLHATGNRLSAGMSSALLSRWMVAAVTPVGRRSLRPDMPS